MGDICMDLDGHLFNLRVAAVILRENRVLTCRFENEPWSFLPGGRVRAGEATADALRRELAEELGTSCELGRAVFVLENLFRLDGRAFHEVGFYYLARVPDTIATSCCDGGRTLRFEWSRLAGLSEQNLQPALLRARLASLPSELTHLVNIED